MQVTAEALLPSNSTAIPLVATCTFTVTILDVNNHGPNFQLQEYKKALKNDLKVNDLVMTVEALDPDEGENGTVYYEQYVLNT